MIRGVTLMFGNLHITTGLVNFLGTHDVCGWSPDHETLPDLSSLCRRNAPWALQKTASPSIPSWLLTSRQVVGGLATVGWQQRKDGSGRFVLPSALSSKAGQNRCSGLSPSELQQFLKALMEMFGSQTALLASRLGSELPRCTVGRTGRWGEGWRLLTCSSFLSPNVSCDPSSPTIRIYMICSCQGNTATADIDQVHTVQFFAHIKGEIFKSGISNVKHLNYLPTWKAKATLSAKRCRWGGWSFVVFDDCWGAEAN